LLACTSAFSMAPSAFSFLSCTSLQPSIRSSLQSLIFQLSRRTLLVICGRADCILRLL
jgi:hypothetical protein